MNRRSFLGSILALGAAPAIVKADSLMRVVRPTFAESRVILWGDLLHDDTAALQAFLDRKPVFYQDGTPVGTCLRNGRFTVSKTLVLRETPLDLTSQQPAITIEHNYFDNSRVEDGPFMRYVPLSRKPDQWVMQPLDLIE